MSPRSLRIRIERLEATIPMDEESRARARFNHLDAIVRRGHMDTLTDAEKKEYPHLRQTLVAWLPPATNDEERARRARWNELLERSRNELDRGITTSENTLTAAEKAEFKELTYQYHFCGPYIKAWREREASRIAREKLRVEEDKRMREAQLRRAKHNAPVAAISAGKSSQTDDETWARAEQTARSRQRLQQSNAPTPPVQVEPKDPNWESIDCDYDPIDL